MLPASFPTSVDMEECSVDSFVPRPEDFDEVRFAVVSSSHLTKLQLHSLLVSGFMNNCLVQQLTLSSLEKYAILSQVCSARWQYFSHDSLGVFGWYIV